MITTQSIENVKKEASELQQSLLAITISLNKWCAFMFLMYARVNRKLLWRAFNIGCFDGTFLTNSDGLSHQNIASQYRVGDARNVDTSYKANGYPGFSIK